MPDAYFIADSMAFNSSLPVANITQSTTDNNPLITIYKSRIESDLFSAKTIKRSYLPTLKYLVTGAARGSGISNAGIYSSNFSDGVQFSRYNYMVGAYFLWNVMDIFRVTHDYKSHMYEVQKDNALLDEARLNLNSQLENANVQLSLAIEQAKEAPIQLSAASTGFNQSKARYESGLGTLLELSQNLYVLARAEADYSITYNNTWRSLLSIAASTGDMNLFLNSIKTK
jgi:outer membrane protein TolC